MNGGVSFDPRLSLATITGPGGFTQVPMSERHARAIAIAFGVPFEKDEWIEVNV